MTNATSNIAQHFESFWQHYKQTHIIPSPHYPVMLKDILQETLKHFDISKPINVLDLTFGAGGYTKAILNLWTHSTVHAVDRDPNALQAAQDLMHDFQNRFIFTQSTFSQACNSLQHDGIKFDVILADLGISSMQVDDGSRGFSFSKEAKLDMRMSNSGITAFEVVNKFKENELSDIIFKYSDEIKAKKIAKMICDFRIKQPIETTTQLASIVFKAYGSFAYKLKTHPATKTFQAIRIFVNRELEELETFLDIMPTILKPKGLCGIVSFHSLEDGMIKNIFNQISLKRESKNKYANFSLQTDQPSINDDKHFKLITPKPLTPSTQELHENIRSRSAKLRFIQHI